MHRRLEGGISLQLFIFVADLIDGGIQRAVFELRR
jgi:hypothetical protein